MKQYLSAFMIACVLIASPGALNCQCVDADCSFVPKATQANIPQCHPAAVPVHREDPSRKACCGKCRIEKAEFLLSELSAVRDVRHQNTLEEIHLSEGFTSKILRLPLRYKEFAESPPGFFERHILNITFSFRAPPQG